MKVFIALIVKNNDGDVSVKTEPFINNEDAKKYLREQYLDIKEEISGWATALDSDECRNATEDSCTSFFINSDVTSLWWCEGSIMEKVIN